MRGSDDGKGADLSKAGLLPQLAEERGLQLWSVLSFCTAWALSSWSTSTTCGRRWGEGSHKYMKRQWKQAWWGGWSSMELSRSSSDNLGGVWGRRMIMVRCCAVLLMMKSLKMLGLGKWKKALVLEKTTLILASGWTKIKGKIKRRCSDGKGERKASNEGKRIEEMKFERLYW